MAFAAPSLAWELTSIVKGCMDMDVCFSIRDKRRLQVVF